MENTPAMVSRPLIGIPTSVRVRNGIAVHSVPEDEITAAMDAAGTMPVLIPALGGTLDTAALLARLDGLLVAGAISNIEPHHYGDVPRTSGSPIDPARDATALPLIRPALAAGVPLLAIRRGLQELNVALGGTLIQHIPDEIAGALAHEQPNPRTEPGHAVAIAKDTLLGRITGAAEMQVNSAHHQAVGEVAGGTVVNATAPDGVIEGIELGAARFVLGVQWHPEFDIDPADRKIFSAFVDAARN